MNLSGRTALITGGAHGIGFSIATKFVHHGCNVVLVDVEDATLDEAVNDLNKQCDVQDSTENAVSGYVGDIRKEPDVIGALAACEDRFRIPDIVVNNAGVTSTSALVDMDVAEWDRVLEVNLRGTFLCTKHAARRWIDTKVPGAIVNLSSLVALATNEGSAHYSASKAAISNFTRVAAAELGPHGIRVNAIAPGIIQTEATRARGRFAGAMGEEFLARIPLGRLGEVEDIADGAHFLVSEESRWITGVTLPIDGGNHVKGLFNFLTART
jgi:3-oxoacyl-[acyl-carrier protein] reductase